VRAAQIHTLEGPSALQIVDVPEPVPTQGQVLVDVHVAGVTFPEVLQSWGRYQSQPTLPFVPGSEVAGIVRSAPEDAAVRAGDEVVAFCGTGGYAEVVAVDAGLVLPVPAGTSLQQAVAYPVNYGTVHFALTTRGQLAPGETVLVHGAAGGVGTAAVQVAAALGARVLAVVSTPEKGAAARQAGAHEVLPVEGFLQRAKELTGGKGVDVVLDPVGGDRFTDSLRSLGRGGRLLVVGFTGGEIPTVRVNRLLLNNIAVVGVGWGAYWAGDDALLRQQWAALLPLIERGDLPPVMGRSFALEAAGQALAELEERRATGKVVLTVR
jgi:NADPH2:quinone reductase